MDRFGSSKGHGAVSLVAVDVIGRIFGCGRPTRSRLKARHLGGLEGYSRLQDRTCLATRSCGKLTPIENLEARCDSADEEEDELTLLQRQRPRSSFSSDDSSKRWTSSTDQHAHRRRKGYYCMRLRIVNMMRIVAMIRKVRLAYRRMTKAAAASKTILSLGDLYNNIADLIPVPCSSSNNDSHTIVVIRPVKTAPGTSEDDEGEERTGLTSGQGIRARLPSTTGRSLALRPNVGHEARTTSEPAEAMSDHIPSSSWRKFAFRTFSCVSSSSVTSCTSPRSSQGHP